ncbi:hypothetical protein D3C72_2573810 [compost metagenome]
MVRITRFSWLSTRVASSLLPATTVRAPTRSPYSENDFEKEELMNMVMSRSANMRTTEASSVRPSPKP